MKKLSLCFLSMMVFVSACGFEPLYVQRDKTGSWYFGGKNDTSIISKMAAIKIEPIEGRFGQMMKNSLLDTLTPKGTPKNPKYRLIVNLQSRSIVQQAMRRDITATNERVAYKVVYRMMGENNKQLLNGDSVAYVSYDIMDNPFSTTMAQKKTEADAAKIIADDIALRIGAYFHAQQNKKLKDRS
ncbi:MAG: hypothetical protein IJV97_01380 [Alphaproteobacteria bacterium]|nr:hypothetical protein [Alphaproteobacteria bacterium]